MMFKYILVFIVLIHGLIHFLGFAKAFNFGNVSQITHSIIKPIGVIWLIVALLFIAVAVFLYVGNNYWMLLGCIATIVSQILILMVWKDAKFGTIANIIMIVAIMLQYGGYRFENFYVADAQNNLHRTNALKTDVLTDEDLLPLPKPVQRYLTYVGAINKPKVTNMRVTFEGQMREKGKDYFPFTCEQYSFFDKPTRLFFMKAKMKGIPVLGYHKYVEATAMMDIRLFGLFPVVQKSGKDMDQAETVTLFNDMCLMAPATLIDQRITWQPIDNLSAKATFKNHNISISAILYFNLKGQLVDFFSNDRDVNKYPFSTPVSNYKNINGINIMTYGETIWHYADGKFTYGKFNLKEVEYNVSEIK